MSDEPLPPIAAVPTEPPAQKRGRGRPPALNPDGSRKSPSRAPKATRDKAPRREPSTTSASASTRRSSLKARIGAQLTMLSMLVSVIPPLANDALSPQEIDALADAIDKQAQTSPRFRKYIERAVTASGAGGLLGVLGIIGARRAARHGIVPPMVDPALGALLGESMSAPPLQSLDRLRMSAEARAQEIEERTRAIHERADVSTPDDLPPFGAPALPRADDYADVASVG